VSQFLLIAAVALTVGAVVFGIAVLITGDDGGLRPVEPAGRGVPLPADRPLTEFDLSQVRFDTAVRGYRMAQVDAAMQRAAYDIGYKDELIKVLQAEIDALREGRLPDAEVLRRAREASLAPVTAARADPRANQPAPAEPGEPGEQPAGPGDGPVDPGGGPAGPEEQAEEQAAGPGRQAAGPQEQVAEPGEEPTTSPGDSRLSGHR
jgi:DivIVA domain-containing protein